MLIVKVTIRRFMRRILNMKLWLLYYFFRDWSKRKSNHIFARYFRRIRHCVTVFSLFFPPFSFSGFFCISAILLYFMRYIFVNRRWRFLYIFFHLFLRSEVSGGQTKKPFPEGRVARQRRDGMRDPVLSFCLLYFLQLRDSKGISLLSFVG